MTVAMSRHWTGQYEFAESRIVGWGGVHDGETLAGRCFDGSRAARNQDYRSERRRGSGRRSWRTVSPAACAVHASFCDAPLECWRSEPASDKAAAVSGTSQRIRRPSGPWRSRQRSPPSRGCQRVVISRTIVLFRDRRVCGSQAFLEYSSRRPTHLPSLQLPAEGRASRR